MVYLPHWPIPATFGNAKIDFETVFERAQMVLDKIGNPHKKLPEVIHIAGTNGKGSTANFLREILAHSGYKTDLYTSPHLHHCNERILLDGVAISDSYLYKTLEEVRIASFDAPLTFFEGFTLAAFLAFSKSNSDFLIIEAGMGGRIDITNIIERKIATIITPISFDHQEFLGQKIAQIAYEKAFIMRPKTNLILAPQPSQARQIIELMTHDQNVNLIEYDRDFSICASEDKSHFDFFMGNFALKNLPRPSLRGDHQFINASVAIACALDLLNFKIEEKAISSAMEKTFWPSRIEKIENGLLKFLPPKSEIFIDGAHNVGGAFALSKFLADEKFDGKNFVIVGFSKGKCKKEFLLQFKDLVDEIIAVRVDGESRPESAEVIEQIGLEAGLKINAQNDLLDAFNYVKKNHGDKKVRITICGSLHLARDVRKFGGF